MTAVVAASAPPSEGPTVRERMLESANKKLKHELAALQQHSRTLEERIQVLEQEAARPHTTDVLTRSAHSLTSLLASSVNLVTPKVIAGWLAGWLVG